MSSQKLNDLEDPKPLHIKSNSAGQLSGILTSKSVLSMQSNTLTIRDVGTRSSMNDIKHIQNVSKLVRSHKDLVNPEGAGDNQGSIIPSRSVANVVTPETREEALAKLRELPPVELPLEAPKKKKNLGTPSLQIFAKTQPLLEEKIPQRSNTTDETPMKLDITKMDPKDVALGLFNQKLAGYNRENVFPLIGKLDPFNNQVLIEYCNLYVFKKTTLDNCLRTLCEHVELKGETQVIDRVLYQISRRYWDCNPEMHKIYKSIGTQN